MPRRQITFRAGEYYHVYNRGHNRQVIFRDRRDFSFFIRKLRASVCEVSDVISYCLMPNHYHLLVRLTCDDISAEMHRLSVAYAKALNKSTGQVGSVFQGPFQAVHVDEESYLLHLTRYIHLNPHKARLVADVVDWEFSSYPEYIGVRNGSLPQPDSILSEFGSHERYREFVERSAAYPPGIGPYLIDDD
jgi:putative transposase